MIDSRSRSSRDGAIDGPFAFRGSPIGAARRIRQQRRMNAAESLAAARLLAGRWRRGEKIDTLPESCRPSSRAEGYAIQEQWNDEVGDAIAGWKIAATSEAGQKHIRVSGPLAGP